MTADKRDRDALVVAAGHERRLAELERRAKDGDAELEAVRAEADQALGRTAPFDGSTEQLDREADRLLGICSDRADLPRADGQARPEWDAMVELNRAFLVADGLDADAIALDNLIDPGALARIDVEWQAFSGELDLRVTERARADLIASFRRGALDAIIRPLGLGRLVERFDRVGGGVLTPHNAEAAFAKRQEGPEMANQPRLEAYTANRSEPYDHSDYEAGFRALRKERFKDDAPLRDAYAPDRELPRDGRAHIDHVIPAKRIHDDRDANFFLSSEQKQTLANAPDNLAFTEASANQSKNDKKPSEWIDRERKDGTTNAERYGVDRAAALEREHRAQEGMSRALVGPKMKYYLEETAKAGAADAVKVGLQQALGAVLVEIVLALFDEVADLWRNGRQGESLIDDFVTRAKRVGGRVLASWRGVVDAFAHGALAGFISTVLTVVINSFVTTARRAVRVIREGILSLTRGIKTLVFPPKGMDATQAAHEASKLIAVGVVVSGGIALEEAVEKAIVGALPVIAPVAPFLSVAVVGLATGLTSVAVVALLDRVDFFGAVARERGETRLAAMRERTDAALDELLRLGERGAAT